ncbi:NAD(P)H-binding protein [Streptomyces sp. NBC_01433]|uniref:NAD(P)H-binding protein n=1 Tax=Streptomyces sp. NBC_01433 TaxID=2903864 RepID=UPI00224E3582|nr:NAD(P)H-binding protein [Streptomyces sp. NBC_01433]MCX4681888.1 NAD(P)H-binding protein [Streptomyces sp. NBC_01433]
MTKHPILMTGGTGKSGSRVVSRLRAQGVPVRVASRSGDPAFDWLDRTTWDSALEGVRALYLVPVNGHLLTRPFVERAVQLGVERVVLLSGRGVDVPGYSGEANLAGATHVDGESAVRDSGITWTVLRPAWFAQNFSEGIFRDAVLAGELRLPAGEGAASFIDAEDIAAVAVAALTEDGHAAQTYELSGPRALTLAEAVAEISGATRRRIRYVPLSPGGFVAELTGQGWPAAEAEDYAEAVSPIRRGMDSQVSDGVRRALGRTPRDFSDYVRAAVRMWHA